MCFLTQNIARLPDQFLRCGVFVCGGEECVCVYVSINYMSSKVPTCWKIEIKIFPKEFKI